MLTENSLKKTYTRIAFLLSTLINKVKNSVPSTNKLKFSFIRSVFIDKFI